MTEPHGRITLHCELEVNGQTIWLDTSFPRRSWEVADEATREAFRARAREALGQAIIRQCQPDVTITQN